MFLPTTDALASSTEWSTSILTLDSLTINHRSVGGAYFVKQQPRLAVATYTRGLALPNDPAESLLLHLNRSAAHLQLENFSQAALDASATLDLLVSSILPADRRKTLKGQALLRQARAFDGMRAFSQARTSYLNLLEQTPSNAEALKALKRVEARLAESATGKFDWVDVFRRRSQGERSLDVGNYIGPVRPEVLEGRGGGRGVVAARDIEAGELLLVEKAFATAHPAPSTQGSSELPREVRLEVIDSSVAGKEADVRPSLMHDLVFNVAARLVENPSLASTVYALHGGDKYPPSCGVPDASFGAEATVPSASCRADVDPERINEINWSNVYVLYLTSGLSIILTRTLLDTPFARVCPSPSERPTPAQTLTRSRRSRSSPSPRSSTTPASPTPLAKPPAMSCSFGAVARSRPVPRSTDRKSVV